MAEHLQSNVVQVNTCHFCTTLCFYTSLLLRMSSLASSAKTHGKCPPFHEAFLFHAVESVSSELHLRLAHCPWSYQSTPA